MTLVINIPSEEHVIFAVDRKVTTGNRYSKEVKIKQHKNIVYAFSGTARLGECNIYYDEDLKKLLEKYPKLELTEILLKNEFPSLEGCNPKCENSKHAFINYAGFIDGKLTSGIYSTKERKILEIDSVFNPALEFQKIIRNKSHYSRIKRIGEILFNKYEWIGVKDESIINEINRLSIEEKNKLIEKFYHEIFSEDTKEIGFGMDLWIIYPNGKCEVKPTIECNEINESDFTLEINEGNNYDELMIYFAKSMECLNAKGKEHYKIDCNKEIKIDSWKEYLSIIIPLIKRNEENQYEYLVEVDTEKEEKDGFKVAVETIVNLKENQNTESRKSKLIVYKKKIACKVG